MKVTLCSSKLSQCIIIYQNKQHNSTSKGINNHIHKYFKNIRQYLSNNDQDNG